MYILATRTLWASEHLFSLYGSIFLKNVNYSFSGKKIETYNHGKCFHKDVEQCKASDWEDYIDSIDYSWWQAANHGFAGVAEYISITVGIYLINKNGGFIIYKKQA